MLAWGFSSTFLQSLEMILAFITLHLTDCSCPPLDSNSLIINHIMLASVFPTLSMELAMGISAQHVLHSIIAKWYTEHDLVHVHIWVCGWEFVARLFQPDGNQQCKTDQRKSHLYPALNFCLFLFNNKVPVLGTYLWLRHYPVNYPCPSAFFLLEWGLCCSLER